MHVMVTGGAGYVGSVLCKELLNQGHEVTVYDTFKYGVSPILHMACRHDFHYVRGDVRDYTFLKKVGSRCDAVIHLAGLVGAPICEKNPIEAQEVHVTGTSNVVTVFQGKPIIYASTGSVYGKVEGVADEAYPCKPLSTYGQTKLDGEHIAKEAGAICGRFATAFGVSPCMRFDLLLHDIIYQAIRNQCFVMYQGHARRTFISVQDIARFYLFALAMYNEIENRVINVGSPDLSYTKKNIADAVGLNFPLEIILKETQIDPDQRDYEVSYDLAGGLGFTAHDNIMTAIPQIGGLVKADLFETKWRLQV